MKVIPVLTMSIPDEGYSSLLTISVPDEGYSSLLTMSVPDEGYFSLDYEPSSGTLIVKTGITFIRYAHSQDWNNLHQVRL
jgi:hypothetical protein